MFVCIGSQWNPTTQAIYKSRKAIKEFRQVKGVPEQPTLVFIPLLCSWHKIKCHICSSCCSFYGTADFGKAWQQK
jgi:hypothetical protein